ncbi:AraC family transcriptional regulator [Microbacterium sp.]|uniref:AraC family transcriptional regulator n=1 Tax=Microbacterium sp. TaxID=51671 RepID=UPI0039E33332
MRIPPVEIAERMHPAKSVLLWQARGSSRCELDGVAEELSEGHALWIPAGVAHALHVGEDAVLLPLHVRARPGAGVLRTPTWIAVDGDLRTLILALLQVQNSIIRPDVDLERRLLRMLQARAVPPTGLPMPVSPTARAIAEQLRDDPALAASVAALAATHHVSARTIERAFIAETGMTLQEWRGRRRMEVAASLLRRTDGPGVVAARVGYRDQSAFRRAFKRYYGMPPGAYARRHGVPR